jgi:hypothetical protein
LLERLFSVAGRFDFGNAFAFPNGVRKSSSGSPVQAQGFRALFLPEPFPAESKQRLLAPAFGQRVVRVTSRAQEDPTNACLKQKLGLTVRGNLIASAGKEEVLFRRIGENEATAIEACHALPWSDNQPRVDLMQKERYASRNKPNIDDDCLASHGCDDSIARSSHSAVVIFNHGARRIPSQFVNIRAARTVGAGRVYLV